MRKRALLGLTVLMLALTLSAFGVPSTGADSHAFPSRGSIRVSVPVGTIHISSTQTDRITLHYRIKPHAGWFSSEDSVLKNIRLRFDVQGNHAEIEFQDSNGNHNSSIDLELDVPPLETLRVNTGVGDIDVRQIVGDKELHTGVGNIRVWLGANGAFRTVEASTGVGDIHAAGLGQATGFVGKSLSYNGNGAYRLTASTGVGDIKLER